MGFLILFIYSFILLLEGLVHDIHALSEGEGWGLLSQAWTLLQSSTPLGMSTW